MSLVKGSKFDMGYASVVDDDGVNYREIAETMTELGFNMYHSSARNYVLRVMKKFVSALAREWQLDLDDKRIDEIAKNPGFQHGVADILQIIESHRREESKNNK